MSEVFGIAGKLHYIVDMDNDEAYSFDTFGGSLGKLSGTAAYGNIVYSAMKVDVVSILGESCTPVCEVYIHGEVVVSNMSYLDTYCVLSKMPGLASAITYTIKREFGVSQILLVFKEGYVTLDLIKSLLSNVK